MRRLEEQILTEKYRRIEGKLTFSVRLAELSVAPGEAAEGAFTIFASQEEIPAQGYVLTKDERMECKTEWFNGVQEKIVYRFCADGLQEGDSLQGQFLIISDYGEYTLPWKVTVRREAAAGIAGKVSTLAGFTELARTDWKTAVQFVPIWEVYSSGAAMRRSTMPVRSIIHSWEVSTIFSRSALVRRRSGT